MKHNKSLLRLDLSNSSLSDEFLRAVVLRLKKAKSLLAIDLSQERELSAVTKEFMRNHLDLDSRGDATDLVTKIRS